MAPDPDASPPAPTPPAAARSARGLVTSPHPRASEAGLAVLAAGGHPIDAVIAASAMLAVVAPHFTGLGGDAFWLITEADGDVTALSGIGQAAARPAAVPSALRGPHAATTGAAAVDVWARGHAHGARRWGGSRPFGDLLAPAIDEARRGTPVSGSMAFWLAQRRAELDAWPGFAAHFAPAGRWPVAGEVLRLPALADSLQRLARHGPREFYEGELAARLAAGLQTAGSPLTAADLAATAAREVQPLRLAYRGRELLTMPPPTQGLATLQAMALLERFDLGALGEGGADHLHLMVEAIKQAFIDRDHHLGDPDFAEVPVARLLGRAHLDTLAARIDRRRALAWPAPLRHGDTVFVGAADASGRGVSALQTIYYDWGSGVVAGDTGILWHNRGAAFSAQPGHPNAWAPGKRPFHTLNPFVVLEQGRPRWWLGTQGADGQPQTLAAVLTRLIDFGLDPLQALARPRFLLGRTFSDGRDSLKLEQDLGAGVLQALAARGHEIATLPARSPLAGQPGVIGLGADGWLLGAHDPRGEGVALGLPGAPGPGR